MKIPLQITFKECDHSPAVEEAIREAAQQLEAHCRHIVHCRVLVEAPHHHHRKGNSFHVRVDVTVPGLEVVTSAEAAHVPGQSDVQAAVRDAFHAAERRVRDHMDTLRSTRDRERLADLFDDVA